MALAQRIDDIVRGLPRNWERARIELTVEDPGDADRAALILAPATPGRSGDRFTLYAHRTAGQGASPELVRRVAARLDAEGIRARVRLIEHEEPAPAAQPHARASVTTPETLAGSWDSLLHRLPPDWSDLYAEIDLDSSDYLERGALLLAPINPARHGPASAFRFRCASTKGYGVAPEMARRALQRLDEAGMSGSVQVLRVLSDTSSTFSQGPVWRDGGRSV
jgi:hypothetical protein